MQTLSHVDEKEPTTHFADILEYGLPTAISEHVHLGQNLNFEAIGLTLRRTAVQDISNAQNVTEKLAEVLVTYDDFQHFFYAFLLYGWELRTLSHSKDKSLELCDWFKFCRFKARSDKSSLIG